LLEAHENGAPFTVAIPQIRPADPHP
jgi:hypothetical protein